MVNSSMDLPIGYPIYVSPLQTSYADTHDTYEKTVFGKVTDPIWIAKATRFVRKVCESCRKHISGSRNQPTSKGDAAPPSSSGETPSATVEGQAQHSGSVDSLTGIQYRDGRKDKSQDDAESDSDSDEQLWKPMWISKRVIITDTSEIFENFRTNWLKWKDVGLAQKAMKSHWKAWTPHVSMEGVVVHEWRPFHIDPLQRSHIDKVILLVKMTEDLYVLIKDQGVKEV